MTSTPARGRGELEREVLACVAAAAGPVTANDVLADLGIADPYAAAEGDHD